MYDPKKIVVNILLSDKFTCNRNIPVRIVPGKKYIGRWIPGAATVHLEIEPGTGSVHAGLGSPVVIPVTGNWAGH